MELKIESYSAVGGMAFGSSREVCRKKMGEPDEIMLLTGGALPIDDYKSRGIYFMYDKYNTFAAIEISTPSQAIFKDKNLLEIPWKQLLDWFRQLDPETEETNKEFISWKFGIAAFAPDKNENPLTLAKSITIFKKDYFYVKDGIPDPNDLTSFHIHAAFVEGIQKEGKDFDSLEMAFRSIFSANKEYGVMLWNSIPIRFSYANDLPAVVAKIVELNNEVSSKKSGQAKASLSCISFETSWDITWDQEVVRIKSHWQRVDGDYAEVLNQWGEITILRREFLAEWKKIMVQCYQAYKLSGAYVKPSSEQRLLQLLKELTTRIRSYGKFYKNEEKIITQSTDGRKQVDLTRLRPLSRFLVSAGIVVLVFLIVWLISRSKNSPYWMLDEILPMLMWTIAISLPLTVIFYLYIRRKNRQTLKH